MAYKDSGALAPSADYTIGDYTFQLRSNYDGDEDVTGIVARMTINGQTSVKGIDIDGQAKIESWSVEANESEATVYVVYRERIDDDSRSSQLNTSPLSQPIPSKEATVKYTAKNQWNEEFEITYEYRGKSLVSAQNGWFDWLVASSLNSGFTRTETTSDTPHIAGSTTTVSYSFNKQYTYQNKTVYYINGTSAYRGTELKSADPNVVYFSNGNVAEIAWTMIYGTLSAAEYGEPKEKLVGRFAIDIHEAGGDAGGDEDWEDPVDYEEGWEEGDPTHTLKVTITGATSGRHNDPLNDPSYSYLPADNTTQKAYGCGGDGGYGGGGGAGASTVIVYKFATDKANSKEVTAIARGHGYGSGGGKGGKGGDGCIIVYY